MVPFEIDVIGEAAGTEVRLDGERVPGLRDVQLRHEVGQLPRLVLDVLPGDGPIAGEAEVEFTIGGRRFVEAEPDPHPAEQQPGGERYRQDG